VVITVGSMCGHILSGISSVCIFTGSHGVWCLLFGRTIPQAAHSLQLLKTGFGIWSKRMHFESIIIFLRSFIGTSEK